MNGLTAWSFQTWVYSAGRIANRYVLGSSKTGVDKLFFQIGDGVSDNGRFDVAGGAGLSWANGSNFTTAWHHWAIVGKTAVREIWVDGTKVAFDAGAGTFPDIDTGYIGRFATVSTGLNAYLDQARFMSVAPTSFPTTDTLAGGADVNARRRRFR
jgi:hypothetical protein